jgi:hypothetical protein
MKRVLPAVLILCIAVLSACSTPPPSKYIGGPRILFTENSADMGEMTPDTSKNYVFHYKNIGDRPLEIIGTSVRALEGC